MLSVLFGTCGSAAQLSPSRKFRYGCCASLAVGAGLHGRPVHVLWLEVLRGTLELQTPCQLGQIQEELFRPGHSPGIGSRQSQRTFSAPTPPPPSIPARAFNPLPTSKQPYNFLQLPARLCGICRCGYAGFESPAPSSHHWGGHF